MAGDQAKFRHWRGIKDFLRHPKMPMMHGIKRAPKNPNQFHVGAFKAKLSSNVAITQHHVLQCGEAFKSHGSPGMQLVGRDADFGPKTIFKAVGKAR